MQELIIVKQLPIIEQHLKEMAAEIDKKTELAKSLVCTEDTAKEVKKVRADLNKQFAELEEQRKAVKNAVMQPYNDFEAIYKECVSDKFKTADSALKLKISEVENELKSQKEKEAKEYFEEYRTATGIGCWLTWEMTGIAVTMSVTVKKLKEQVKEFIDHVTADISVIEVQENNTEILVEYQKTVDLASAIQTVKTRKERLAQAKAAEEVRKQAEAEKAAHAAEVEKAAELSAPKVEKKEESKKIQLYVATFKVKGTLEQLKELKSFLNERGIKYEC